MAPRLRLFAKKRGHRRSTSKQLAAAWEGGLFALLTVVGIAGSWAVLSMLILPEFRANNRFERGEAHVLDRRIGQTRRDGMLLYRPEILIEYDAGDRVLQRWTYDIHTVRGNGYTTDRDAIKEVLAQFPIDESRAVPCWYNPENPEEVILVRGYRWWFWAVLLVPVSLFLIGSGGLIYMWWTWGKSTERLAVERPTPLPIGKREGRRDARDWPGVPPIPAQVETPGERLAYRLPTNASPVRRVLPWLAAAGFWNGIVLVAFLINWQFGYTATWSWGTTLFWLLALCVGVYLIMQMLRQAFSTVGIGPTIVETSDYPLLPGERYRVFVKQAGALQVKRFEVFLECEEEATFEHGTNTRRESRRVFRETIARHEKFAILNAVPYECECEIEIPERAMHSFKSEHNEVRWRLVVRIEADGWPPIERAAPLIVRPVRVQLTRQAVRREAAFPAANEIHNSASLDVSPQVRP